MEELLNYIDGEWKRSTSGDTQQNVNPAHLDRTLNTVQVSCAQVLVQAFEEAGLPKGVLNLVHGPGSSVGNVIVDDPRVKAISFTGSNAVGTRLYAQAARRLCRGQLELGGKNPVVVLEDADLEKAANDVALGAYGSSGQRCTATSRAVVVEPILEEFTELVADR